MLLIAVALVVLLSVAGGFLFEGGKLLVLNQPAQFVIIGGAAIGGLLISTRPSLARQLLKQCLETFHGGMTKEQYIELLAMLYQLFKVAQQHGIMALETHFENPAESAVMSTYPRFLPRRSAVDFFSD